VSEAGPHLHLYAVVPSSEVGSSEPCPRGVRHVECGPVAAIVGRSRQPTVRAVRHHDQVLGCLLMACSSVVPFRFGVDLDCEDQLRELVARNLLSLSRCLARVRGRVEMGVRVMVFEWSDAAAARLKTGLVPFRGLVPRAQDRCERLERAAEGRVFDGSYLIARGQVDGFWSALSQSRSALGDVPILGSGPWAAYSFCNVVLRPSLS
jgi:Gas vesicle synthesis protein GvpL/GvpF